MQIGNSVILHTNQYTPLYTIKSDSENIYINLDVNTTIINYSFSVPYNTFGNYTRLIVDFMLEDDRSGTHLAALWQLQHLAFTPTAKSITPKWLSKIIEDNDFHDVLCDNLIPGMTKVIRGTKSKV